ncbi:ABC-F family ATP-binding cassette domain-containing protein [Kineosporia sp. J2-2]|uniref:ABC-F family ATP-binding cassette domain-containing protein n=1 Tax=Kineosporia corallincola TaxID=2835133 RepID=A0ABS5THJ2_9ACTN|nr:ABC-F family ATP-binding cassette domain-containing protein [Kineosporia corallincola]MBT0770565.1 ABC-F family ATP-binding cassette domain-containing protein [Kineosporia corallincola]
MAHLLNAESVTVVHGSRTLLDAVSLGLDDGDRIGVVGRNGEGKSTLLRVLARRQEPDGGRVTQGRDVRLGALWQEDRLDPEMTVREAVMGQMAAHEWAGDARVRDVLGGILGGLEAPAVGGLDAKFGRLSGGQRRRVGLAALLIGDHDLVMLDEPTNHLDVEGVAWLARHLNERWPAGRGGLLVVTHDRWFLDAVCGSIWEVHDGVVDSYEGGYAAYVLTRAERARVAAVTEERRQNTLRKELAWLQRGAPARTSKPRFRIDAAESLIADEPPPRDQMNLAKMATARLGKDVVDLEDVTLTVGSGDDAKTLLEHVTWRLGPGDRIGVVGVNGSGKTTLMRLMLGGPDAPVPAAGRVKRGKTVQAVTLSQDVRELDAVADQKVQEAVEKVRGTVRIGNKDVTAGQLLERLGFTKDKIWTRVGDLSGGERRRLQLLRLLMAEPNVLLLDEPTNDLDTDTLAAIEDTLDEWPGTLIVVSHDRYLLERLCDRQVALLGDRQIRDLPGGVEEYLRLRAQQEEGAASSASSAVETPESSGVSAADARAARKEMARIERQIAKLGSRAEKLHAQMAEKATDHTAIAKLDAELREITAEKDQLEEDWLEAAEAAG